MIVVGLFGGDVVVPTPFFPIGDDIQGSYVGSLTEIAELLELVKPHRRAAGAGRDPAAGPGQRPLNDLRDGKVSAAW